MDVICEHCRTEYEFDETLLSDRGTTVKCTTCGHTFRLFPTRVSSTFRVRRQDGTLQTFATLEDVRTQVERGQLTEDDELSEHGGAWTALAEVPELTPLFARGRTRRARRATPQGLVAPQKATLLGVGHNGPPASDATRVSVPNPTARTSSSTLMGYGTPVAAQVPQVPAPAEQPRLKLPSDPPPPRVEAPRPSFTPPAQPVSQRPPAGRPKERPNLYLDEPDRGAPKSKGLGVGGAIVLVVLAAGLGAGGFYAYQQWKAEHTRAPEAASAMLVAEGEREASADTADAYRVAVGTFDRVHQRYPDHWAPLAALARTHAYWAQSLLFEAKDAAASPLAAEVRRADTLRELARQHASEAWRYADRARALAPHDVHVLVAAADAARLEGRDAEAGVFLDEAMRGRTGMSGHPHYVKALMALGADLDDAAAALPHAERAVALEPDRPVYRLLLARIELMRGESARARAAVDLVLAETPDHPQARAIARLLDAGATAADAGVPDASEPARRRRDDDNATPPDLP